MVKQPNFKENIQIMLKLLKKIFLLKFKTKDLDTSNYRLLRMNRKLSFKQK